MDLIAHRGFAGVNPENTVAAVRAAADQADLVEVDVRRCGSGELVVIHDETVDRVADASGAVADLTADELAAMDVLDSGEGIPTLRALLAAVPPAVGVNLELKERGIATDALTAAERAGVDVLVSAFDGTALDEARLADPDVPRAALFAEDPEANLALARELDCAAVHPHVPLAARTVEPAHDAGLAVNVWTIESASAASWLADLGVDGAIADRPDVVDSVDS